MAVVLLLLPNVYREAIARGVRASVLRPVLALQQGAIERNTLFDDPARLRAQRDSLAAYLVGNAAIEAENRRLRELLGLRGRLPQSFVPAEIIRIPGRAAEGYFQLTAGSNQGIAAGSSIVAAEGLVGRVRELDGNIAFGIDWMHPEFRASAMTPDGQVYGIVEPRQVDGNWLLALTGTPRHVELDEGAMILTSGHGGVFPRGIPIGRVVGQEGGAEGWQRNYLIEPLVGPSEMTYVLVLGESQTALEGQDLALVWGIRPPGVTVQPQDPSGAAGSTSTGGGGGSTSGQSSAGGGGSAAQPAQTQPEAAAPPTQAAPAGQGPGLLGEPIGPQ